MSRPYDIILWGSTGFTGQLAAQYLSEKYPTLRVAIAGRNKQKLEEIKQKYNLNPSIGVLVADVSNPTSLDAIIGLTTVLISAAGPYALIGTPIVESCIRCGTDYCDITGEAQWVKSIIENYHQKAVDSKVRIVHTCGFDCIPSDVGCYLMVKELKKKGLTPIGARMLVDKVKGAASGGTIASVINLVSTATYKLLSELSNPYYLVPASLITKPIPKKVMYAASDATFSEYDKVLNVWTGPFVMQAINTRVVNRSNAISGWSYGPHFIYDERVICSSRLAAVGASLGYLLIGLLISNPITRFLLKFVLPKPGEGPDEDTQMNGFFYCKLWGTGCDPVTGKTSSVFGGIDAPGGDPGYKQTAKMLCESALCLAFDKAKCPVTAGCLTPSVAFGDRIIERLDAAGIKFYITETPAK